MEDHKTASEVSEAGMNRKRPLDTSNTSYNKMRLIVRDLRPHVIEEGALSLQDTSSYVNVRLNPARPICVADPERNLVAERDQEAQRDQAAAVASRFEARRLAPPWCGLTDPSIETAILAPAANFPLERVTYPRKSTFIPCFISVLYYLNQMDHMMASIKRWTDGCMGWVPPYSQIYISVLLYIQVIRAMDSARILPAGSRLILLRELERMFPFSTLWIPGPLVSAFKNLACFWPSATGKFGIVSPSLPATPEWSEADRFSFGNRFASHLPNISIFISRLHSICSAATRPAVTEALFCNDVDGPKYMATLFSHACVRDDKELINVASPGASCVYSGGLRLWQDAANYLRYYDLPPPLDAKISHVENDWVSALRMNNSSCWLGPLAAMMGKYCQFWKGSCPLSDCSPNGSLISSVQCVATDGTNVFQGPAWTNETGTHESFQHGNANQVGHYNMRFNLGLTFKASTTIDDIPDAHVYAALTYHFNLAPNDAGLAVLNNGPFWDVNPPAYHGSGIQVYQGIIPTIARLYHSDKPVDSEH